MSDLLNVPQDIPRIVNRSLLLPTMASFRIENITTPILLGSLFDFLLCGTLLVQTYAYYISFPKDPLIFKCLVCFVMLTMIVYACLNASDLVFWFATSFGNPLHFIQRRFSKFYIPILTVLLASCVQSFFAFRITVIRKAAWPISLLIVVISLTQLVAGIMSGTLAFIEDNQPDSSLPGTTAPKIHQHIRVILIPMWIVGGATADILIAITMTVLLSKATASESTQSVANKIIRLVLETNSCTAAVAIICVVLYFVLPPTNLYVYLPVIALIGLYANTLLVTLNNRAIILRAREQQPMKSGQRTTAISAPAPPRQAVIPEEFEYAV
ncbi:hypothetical protein R3P38DRAFT_2957540 [Favolaschia claudopus]|uniref:DUF6534 domain-containing protein n=1 Tax=Favolaschia claudopus TaxID=2862362 RepID=A0AAW0BAF8_9AGAR